MINKLLYILVLNILFSLNLRAQNSAKSSSDVVPFQVTVKESTFKGKNALALEIKGEADGDNTLAILKNTDFHNGIIEASISGQTLANASETARGFVGIAFRAALDASKAEVFIYVPPMAVQMISYGGIIPASIYLFQDIHGKN